MLSGTAIAQDDAALELARKTLAQLTLEEKVALCHGNGTITVGALPRVGLNSELVLLDGVVNVRPDLARDSFRQIGGDHDYSTSLPAPIALAATWDPQQARQAGEMLGRESRDRGVDVLLGPGVNILRTPLCGRNWEYMGEDPFLAAQQSTAMIQGIQKHDVAACVKHYALNNQEANRHGVNVEVDERALREIYLPAFESAVKNGGVLAVMNAYNKFRGEHCSHHDYLNNRILKGEWGFKGIIVTDWGSVHDTVKGALGGTDLEMNAGDSIRYFKQPLVDAVKAGQVPLAVLDDKVLRMLYVQARLNKFAGQTRAPGARNTPAHQQLARRIAESAIVVLKNERNLLPLNPAQLKHVLVLGKNAVHKHCTSGYSSEGKPPYEVTPLEALKKRLGPGVAIVWHPLSSSDRKRKFENIPEGVITTWDTTSSDVGITVRGWNVEYFNNTKLEGKPVLRGFDKILDFNWKKESPRPKVLADQFSARWTTKILAPETGTYAFSVKCDDGARLWVGGQMIIDEWKPGNTRTVIKEIALDAGKAYDIRVEYFEGSGEASLVFKWELPSSRGADFAQIKQEAQKADAVLIFTGNEHGHGRAMECEGGDRPHLLLPEGHDEAIAELLPVNPRTVVVNLSGTPVAMPWEKAAATLVQYWFAGMEGGNALAAVLLGDVNPSGKLPFTFPRKLEDSPAHALGNYNEKQANYAEGILVGYRWFDTKKIEPMFPFGHGLSYTTFRLGALKLSQQSFKPGQQVQVQVDVTNTGRRAGAEVVQLYVHDPNPHLPKATRELKGFAKVMLQAGETRTATLTLTPRDLAYFDETGWQWKADPGKYIIEIGSSSRDIRGKAELRLEETFTEVIPK